MTILINTADKTWYVKFSYNNSYLSFYRKILDLLHKSVLAIEASLLEANKMVLLQEVYSKIDSFSCCIRLSINMDINLKILVINLKASSERRARISKQLDSLDISYEFLEATEGSVLNNEWIENNIGDRLKNIYYNNLHRLITKNALACADSHRRAQLIACDFESGYTLILEDDVELTRDFNKKIKNTIKLMREHSLHLAFPGYNLARGSCEKRLDMNSSGLGFSFFKYPTDGRVSGAYSYVVDSVGARKLVNENLEKIQNMADIFRIEEKKLNENTVVLYPKIVTTGYLESDIDYSTSGTSLIKRAKRMTYSLSIKSRTIHYVLRYWKERRW